ncbi:MAG: hypothetical protein A3H31_04640 [Gallionellales bacterium RIFCSPLOWO2_02_FULL_57_47]|nr:MAG: hypothetical protein A3H31_04640 [Gallionellales bacterium RIFCSPLOWO2_02_FULL_57_47]OGT16508.1 MAG: hypothetical protein A3J49_17740 [Gallionellales bacterium RIFCSPHIGHO2_02_FULL_57_16]
MEVNRIISISAGFMVMLSLGLAHWMGQVDLSHAGWLWLTLFVGFNVFQMGFTGFCPMAKGLRLFGVKNGSCGTSSGNGKSCC